VCLLTALVSADSLRLWRKIPTSSSREHTTTSKILAIEHLGKFKSVTCLLDTETDETEFWTMSTDRPYLLKVL